MDKSRGSHLEQGDSTDQAKPSSQFGSLAVIGMAMRLPGGIHDGQSLWNFLMNGHEGRCKVPVDRYNVDAFYAPGQPDSVASKYGFFLNDISLRQMDPSFWSMTKREIEETDPQQRLALEVAFECLENSGTIDWRGSDIGTFFGVFGEDWHDMHHKETLHQDTYGTMSNGDYFISNRIAYELDLKGPSLTTRSGCSSSLASLHAACASIHNGDCTSAIVGGVNLILNPEMTIAMSQQGVLSEDARSKTFDEAADGYGRGEACVAIHIKALDAAIRDGDPVRAVIRAVTMNHDGKTSGLFHPSSQSHCDLMKRTQLLAGYSESDWGKTAMIECHGTGTAIGDPLEANAVAEVFGDHGMYIGSVKPNFGHSEGASGIVSMLKSILTLENRMIPPNRNFNTPNTKIPWRAARLRVPVEPTAWPADRAERIGVNSFGIGGLNAHVLLESASMHTQPKTRSLPSSSGKKFHLVVLSAHSAEALECRIQQHLDYLEKAPERLVDLSYTLNRRRQPLEHRGFRIIDPKDHSSLRHTYSSVQSSETPDLTFAFTGQGAQWPEMGRDLIESDQEFRRCLENMDAALQSCSMQPNWSILEEVSKTETMSRLHLAEYAQPCCTALQIALVDRLAKLGIKPSAVVGHSSGEIAAAYAAESIGAWDAIRLAYFRGLAVKHVPEHLRGGMAAVGIGRVDVEALLASTQVQVACENSDESVTLSGDLDDLERVLDRIKSERPEIFVRKLPVDKAYHGRHMETIASIYQDMIGSIEAREPTVPFASSVSGSLIESSRTNLDASYWVRNLVSPVQFLSAVRCLGKIPSSGRHVIIEIGPHAALKGPLQQIHRPLGKDAPVYIPTLVRGQNGERSMLETTARLFQQNAGVDLGIVTPVGNVLTDLPRYPWQHRADFWAESRLSKEWRLREYGHHELLGSRINATSPFDSTWRNKIRLDDVPWLREHIVNNSIIFPGACYIAIGGEAMSQLTRQQHSGYSVRGVNFANALVLHEGESVELITHVSTVSLSSGVVSSWYEWSVSSYNGTDWTKHATGEVRPCDQLPADTCQPDDLSRSVQTASWYAELRRRGLEYGPSFQNLQSIKAHVCQHKALGVIRHGTGKTCTEYAIHPIAIDNALQLMTVASCKGLTRNVNQLLVPVSLAAASFRQHDSSATMEVQATSQRSLSGNLQGDAVGYSSGRSQVLYVDGLRMVPIAGQESEQAYDSHAAGEMMWLPDLAFLSKDVDLFRSPKDIKLVCRPVDAMALACIIDAHRSLANIEPAAPHLGKFKDWLGRMTALAAQGKYPHVPNCKELALMEPAERRDFIERVASETREGEASPLSVSVHRIYQSLDSILSGQAHALDILLEDGVLEGLYSMLNCVDVRRFFTLESHRKPNLKILEIGAGTGGLTSIILPTLTPDQGAREYFSYTYTDVSPGFFQKARERFKKYSAIEYQTLDVTKDIVEQGFDDGTFDIIVAANVLHATPDLDFTLANVRRLLAPEGKLLLQELNDPVKSFNYIMGGLEGWWMGADDGRPDEPYISPTQWDERLRKVGFGGIASTFSDGAYCANMIATLPQADGPDKNLTLLIDRHAESSTALANYFESIGYNASICILGENPKPGQDILALLDLNRPFLHSMSEKEHGLIKELFSHLSNHPTTGVLWVTKCCQRVCADPGYGMTLGVARTIRCELSLDFGTLELERIDELSFDTIAKVFARFHARQDAVDGTKSNMEWMVEDGEIRCPRFRWKSVSDSLQAVKHQTNVTRLDIGRKGFLDSVQWIEDFLEEPQDGEIRILVRAVGLNFKDILIAQGIVEGPHLGCECAGIVLRTGGSNSGFQAGDRVMAFTSAAFATEVNVSEQTCVRIPDSLTFEDASTIPVVFATALYCLSDMARMESSMTALIHSACGGVGLAAIQLCKLFGVEVFCTVGSQEKVDYLTDELRVPRDHIFSSREESFHSGVMHATDRRGVDIVLNSLSGELLQQSWKCVAEFGVMVEISKRDVVGGAALPMSPFEQNRSYIGVDLAHVLDKKPGAIQSLLQRTMDLLRDGKITPIRPTIAYEAANIDEALRFFQKGQHIGKLVITMPQSPSDLDPVRSVRPVLEFARRGSYVLAGGLGGLGKAIAIWMAERGAGEIIFLARSAESGKHAELASQLSQLGCRPVMVAGSVADKTVVAHALRRASWPIRGVLQASMILEARNMLQSSFTDWESTTAPRVQGTWNLHECLKPYEGGVDFFVMLSSISGTTGQPGLSSYAAANTFLDSFANWRRSQGLAASTIDIGAMADVGYVSEQDDVRDSLTRQAMYFLHEQDLLDTLELQMMTSKPVALDASADAISCPRWSDGLLTIGVRSTLPISSSSNRTIWKNDVRFTQYHNIETQSNTTSGAAEDETGTFLTQCADDPSTLQQPEAAEFVARKVSETLGDLMLRDAESFDVDASMEALGMDSLVSIELRNWFRHRLGVEVSVAEIMRRKNILDLGKHATCLLGQRYGDREGAKESNEKYFHMKAP